MPYIAVKATWLTRAVPDADGQEITATNIIRDLAVPVRSSCAFFKDRLMRRSEAEYYARKRASLEGKVNTIATTMSTSASLIITCFTHRD